MTHEPHDRRSPRRYEIVVRGQLGETLRHAFRGLETEQRVQDTVLRGLIPDQAALHGVLAQVEALGLELLDLRRLPTNSSPELLGGDPPMTLVESGAIPPSSSDDVFAIHPT